MSQHIDADFSVCFRASDQLRAASDTAGQAAPALETGPCSLHPALSRGVQHAADATTSAACQSASARGQPLYPKPWLENMKKTSCTVGNNPAVDGAQVKKPVGQYERPWRHKHTVRPASSCAPVVHPLPRVPDEAKRRAQARSISHARCFHVELSCQLVTVLYDTQKVLGMHHAALSALACLLHVVALDQLQRALQIQAEYAQRQRDALKELRARQQPTGAVRKGWQTDPHVPSTQGDGQSIGSWQSEGGEQPQAPTPHVKRAATLQAGSLTRATAADSNDAKLHSSMIWCDHMQHSSSHGKTSAHLSIFRLCCRCNS